MVHNLPLSLQMISSGLLSVGEQCNEATVSTGIKLVQSLVEMGVPLNETDPEGKSVLMINRYI